MAAHWKNFKVAMKEKRADKRKGPSTDILQQEEIVFQRLSAEVSGKALECSRIGLREFVPNEYLEMTLNNIKNAWRRHFAPVVGERMICDVLAGEQGLSCTSLDQIPDLKVVHVRFIEPNDQGVASVPENRVERVEQPKKMGPRMGPRFCCSNTDQYNKDVQGKLNLVFVVKATKLFGNVGNDQEFKV